MRIRRVDVGSYGRMRDRSFDVSEGMTVFHGPNESGKTTLMEFIRNTLVPTRKNDVYPERSKTDSGSITVDDGGVERTVTLTHRARGGDVPECIEKLDPNLYRSIYAMNAESLGDRKLLDSGELAQRFLTVPGSDGMSDAMEGISDRVDEVLGKTKSSDSELMRTERELKQVGARIDELRQRADAYGDLCRQRDELESKLRVLDEASEADSRDRDVFVKYQSQAGNYGRLAELREEREGLGIFSRVTSDGEECYRKLDTELESRRRARDEAKTELDGQKARLGGTDPRVAEDLRERMEDAAGEYSLYQSRRRNSGSRSPPEPVYTEKPDMRLVVLGIVLAAAGVALTFVTVYAAVLAVAGAAAAVAGFVRKVRVQTGTREGSSEDYTQETEAYEREVAEIMRLLGRQHTSVDADVQAVRSILNALPAYRMAEDAYGNARTAFMKADMEMMQFTNGFGGRERFLESMRKSREAEKLDASIKQLSDAISASGLDPMQPVCPVEEKRTDSREHVEIGQRLGEVEAEIRSVLDMGELEELLDRRAALKARRKQVLREGAVAYLALVMAERACEKAYGEMHPGVIATADRYLSMMTGGRYEFDLDPRNKGLAVRDSEGVKTAGQWSSGLTAQVLLSVKLAVAKELGQGEVPVILDDVLLPFDTSRKEGAVRALAEVSREMQVLLFTCDDQTAGLAEGVPGVRLTSM